jgi:AsmA protein
VLPDVPFKTDRWASIDADVQLRANQIRGAKWLPLDRLDVHATLRDAVLTLSPLDFGVAGGQLRAELMLDGRKDPIHAQLQLKVNKLLLSRLFPAAALNEQASIGEINGAFQLTGNGNSIQRMLASARGDMALLVNHGEVSQLLMERAGLHLWEILRLNVAGDKRIVLRCAVADFDVRNGVMTAKTLTIDTAVTTLLGSGTIDLGLERLDITFNQKTKNTSPLALRSPIYIHGSFAHPSVAVDKGRVALRAAGSVALGLINPVLALIPLVDPGPGRDSDCAQLLSNAQVISHH